MEAVVSEDDSSCHQHVLVREADDDSGHSPQLSAEIDRLVAERSELRDRKQWNEADRLKMILLANPYSVELFDRSDGVTVWRKINETTRPAEKRVVWSAIDSGSCEYTDNVNSPIPLVIATVDASRYRARLKDTLGHLSQTCEGTGHFSPISPVNLLNLKEHPSPGPKRIIFEGWRQIMLPHLLQSLENPSVDDIIGCSNNFLLVAEDDVRLPDGINPNQIRDVCKAAFEVNSNVQVLSLGHAWAPTKPSRRQRRRQRRQNATCSATAMAEGASSENEQTVQEVSPPLLQHLQGGGGVHGTTLLAFRAPEGIRSLLDALNAVTQAGKKTHFDQFLFHSTLHDVGLALSDPPLVGWAEVSETLTAAGPGNRRNGEGRLEYLPSFQGGLRGDDINIQWVRRELGTV